MTTTGRWLPGCASIAAALGVEVPRVRWYRAIPAGQGENSYEWVCGFHTFGESVIWLNIDYASPEDLARTVAHEAVHFWQGRTRRPSVDDLERTEREHEAQRRAEVIVPKRSVRTPRGKKRDAWFEPARRGSGDRARREARERGRLAGASQAAAIGFEEATSIPGSV